MINEVNLLDYVSYNVLYRCFMFYDKYLISFIYGVFYKEDFIML